MENKRDWVFADKHPCLQKKCEHFKNGKTPADDTDMFEPEETVCDGCEVNFFHLAIIYKEHPCTGCSGMEFPEEKRDCTGCETEMWSGDLVMDKGYLRFNYDKPILESFNWEEREKDFS